MIHVSAITGSTGAGQSPTATTHFSWRSNNASVYKAFTHQHLKEIKESVSQLQPNFTQDVHFIPMRGAFTRGILAAVYLKSDLSSDHVLFLLRDEYKTGFGQPGLSPNQDQIIILLNWVLKR